ncbi:hypothetical protein COY17_01280 [Candidatus Saccharibacteria bacterium CG_4_10_14_0_2_um_filter_52_9]|nr:MAG: hypothetical protein COY17_01280 [Candidatus Saccharibacteria bacterium CG_4_10_14_0_2_um_filter_52_9]
MNPIIAFVTGLTAGGLSCLAVQAGLLTTSIGDQAKDDIEEELRDAKPEPTTEPGHYERGHEFIREVRLLKASGLRHKRYAQALQALKYRYPKVYVVPEVASEPKKTKLHTLQPVTLFLTARLAAYTALGFLLGWVGTALQLTPYTRAALLIVIGIFMLGTALRMLNVHPIFRHFVIEPPKKVTRYMRKKAKNDGVHKLTPIVLGSLTVLIPCGITQVMMAAAIATGNPLAGATIMFAFILGTSPIFFVLAFLTTRLEGKLQSSFLKLVGVIILVLSLVSINGGLNLAGSPLSLNSIQQSINDRFGSADKTTAENSTPPVDVNGEKAPTQSPTASSVQSSDATGDVLKLTASSASYSPGVIKASANKAHKLEITSKDNGGCGRAFTIPSLGKQEILPENGVTTIDIPPQQTGKMRMTCAMGMYNAVIEFS